MSPGYKTLGKFMITIYGIIIIIIVVVIELGQIIK